MSENSKMFLTKSIIIRGLNQKQYDVLVDVSSKLNELRNCAWKLLKCLKLLMEDIMRKPIISQ